MRIATLLSAVLASALAQTTSAAAADTERTASVYLQPITSSATEIPPTLLAKIRYSLDPRPSTTSSESDSDGSQQQQPEVISYEAPDLPEETKLLRVGFYDPSSKKWISSTSVASVENFGKGYSPNFVLTVGDKEEVLGVSVRGIRIDAGQTRDFGPQAVVTKTGLGPQPELNKPVVLSPEGRKVEVVEKTFLQK